MELSDFVGAKLLRVGRSLNMCWLTFINQGEKYALHIQSAWNITENSIVILGDNDFYNPKDDNEENFDWSVIGSTLFDKKAEQINDKLLEIDVSVKDIQLSLLNELTILLTNDYCVRTFSNASDNSEMWRAFEKGKSGHFVAYSNNIVVNNERKL